jgi:hypothetical protein
MGSPESGHRSACATAAISRYNRTSTKLEIYRESSLRTRTSSRPAVTAFAAIASDSTADDEERLDAAGQLAGLDAGLPPRRTEPSPATRASMTACA